MLLVALPPSDLNIRQLFDQSIAAMENRWGPAERGYQWDWHGPRGRLPSFDQILRLNPKEKAFGWRKTTILEWKDTLKMVRDGLSSVSGVFEEGRLRFVLIISGPRTGVQARDQEAFYRSFGVPRPWLESVNWRCMVPDSMTLEGETWSFEGRDGLDREAKVPTRYGHVSMIRHKDDPEPDRNHPQCQVRWDGRGEINDIYYSGLLRTPDPKLGMLQIGLSPQHVPFGWKPGARLPFGGRKGWTFEWTEASGYGYSSLSLSRD